MYRLTDRGDEAGIGSELENDGREHHRDPSTAAHERGHADHRKGSCSGCVVVFIGRETYYIHLVIVVILIVSENYIHLFDICHIDC